MTTGGADLGGGPTARRIVLGSQLRRLREQAAISRADAGYQIRASESKISRMELGRVGFKERDVSDLLTMYGVSDPKERAVYLDMVKESNQAGWWQRYSDLTPKWFDAYLGLEEAADRIQTYELQFVPGLLQTEDYARAVASHGMPDKSNDDVERRVAMRMRRQKVLARPNAPRLWVVVDESVIRRPIGGCRVHREQIDKLLELTSLPHITLQYVPYEQSGYAAEGAFTLLRFAAPELPNIAYVEHLTGAVYVEKPEDIEVYSRALDRLAVDAETPDRTRQWLTKVRAEV
ncbi:Helix-turn-helix domain-containing protein [Amycolatopsis arida]|uniref:Helix-turn-helix domain-containing protein n=1 Tax=Amycolatopsis arida TaxID=587909 RepID=A0A1I5SZ36_9PSEU|nr:helix-turn-helix transcriptional regulator [Amycolatopsis arida]TDX96295.1 helix-turn-helix protein [Amycolatopsis arida]SFP75891.1 Helix-turn-helix domain-containing protein [Amycolatopsis arida]